MAAGGQFADLNIGPGDGGRPAHSRRQLGYQRPGERQIPAEPGIGSQVATDEPLAAQHRKTRLPAGGPACSPVAPGAAMTSSVIPAVIPRAAGLRAWRQARGVPMPLAVALPVAAWPRDAIYAPSWLDLVRKPAVLTNFLMDPARSPSRTAATARSTEPMIGG